VNKGFSLHAYNKPNENKMLLTCGSHEVYRRILVEFWWNDSTGVDQQLFNVVPHERQISGDGLETDVDLEGRPERLHGAGSRLDATGGAARPAVDVDATARAAGVDDDRVLVPGRRAAAATRPHRAEVQGPSTSDGVGHCAVIESQEQLKQQRRTENDRERRFRERRHLVPSRPDAKPSTSS